MISRLSISNSNYWAAAWGVIHKLRTGRIHRAAEIAEQADLRRRWYGRWLSGYLTRRLVKNAFWNWQQNNFQAAWADFGMADRVVPTGLQDWLTSQKGCLVEGTIQGSEELLQAGQAETVAVALASLKDQKISDWRAERALAAAKSICEAERLAREGHWKSALQRLHLLEQQRGDLHYLSARLGSMQELHREHSQLTQKLRQAICGSRLDAARMFADQLLAISPEDATAIAARKTLNRETHPELTDTQAPLQETTGVAFLGDRSISTADPPAVNKSAPARIENFVMWVDGVGGFLVCLAPVINAGSYVDRPGVDIPIQADLRRRHLRFELHHDQFLVVPTGPLTLAGKSISEATVLKDDQILELTGQVKWRFRQSHPLSSSARIDFASPHRTVPWSDAILLMADTLIIGPQRHNHVCCPEMKSDLILFRHQGRLFARSESTMLVDGREVGSVTPLQPESSICGADFSIKLEPVWQPV